MAAGKKTGGRKQGATNIKTREIAEKAIKQGITPLEVMLSLMRKAWDAATKATDPKEQERLEDKAGAHAKDAAPYLHAKLQPVDRAGSADLNITVKIVKHGEEKK